MGRPKGSKNKSTIEKLYQFPKVKRGRPRKPTYKINLEVTSKELVFKQLSDGLSEVIWALHKIFKK